MITSRLGWGRPVSFAALLVGLAACGLDSQLPGRSGGAAPVNSGVTLSGAGAADDVDAAVGSGPGSRISDLNGGSGGRRAAADALPAGTASGGASVASVGGIGGAASSAGGAFAAGVGAGTAGSAANSEAAGAAGASANEPPPLLWFSEYLEGSSSNKALEITAAQRAVLDGCKVGTYFNGKTEATIVATLSGVLEAGQVLTLCSSSLKEKLPAICNQASNLTFNGDDVVTLSCDGALLDVIGQIGIDPGVAWGSDTNSTADHTLRRKCSVSSGEPLGSDAFEPSSEWLAFPVDTFDGLGARGC